LIRYATHAKKPIVREVAAQEAIAMKSFIASIMVALVLVAGSAMAQDKTIVKYAISDPEGPLPAAQALKTFKNYVEFRSNGTIEVQAFFGTMGAARETTEQTKLGVLQMTNAEDGSFAGFYPKIQAINLPYLFSSGAAAWDFMHGDFARHMADDIRNSTGLVVLAFTENGFRKMRVMQSPVFIEFMKSMGAGATPIPINELVLALKQGVVDGQENDIVFMKNWGITDVQKYISMTEHVYSMQLYLANAKFFASLRPDQQEILTSGAQLASMHNIVLREGQVGQTIEKIRAEGINVRILSPAEKQAFREVTQGPVLAYLKQTLGDDFMNGLLKAVAESEARVGGAKTN
jgi:TRAP-type C4-dicarboxylate transport system substrate-binding protein